MIRLFLIALMLTLGFAARSSADASGTPAGRWLTTNHQAVIQIAPCGTELCGQIVGIALAHPGDKMPDDWRGRPQCGLTIIETAPVADGAGGIVWQGFVLDPRNGTVYHAKLKLDANRELLLHGYVGLPIFGQTQTWTRYSGQTLADCRIGAPDPRLASAG